MENNNSTRNLTLRIEKIADFSFYTEGPAMDSLGNSFCTTLSAGIIFKVDINGRITEWARSPSPNGQIILPDDSHLICDSIVGIRRFDSRGRWIKNETGKSCSGVQVYSPNDLVSDKDGNIYYTDSVRNTGKVCFLGKDGSERILADKLDFPNGLALSYDENYLYVAESYKNRILKIQLKGDVSMPDSQGIFAYLPKHPSQKEVDNLPDGLALDNKGNIWVAHYGMQAIQVLSPEGNLLDTIDTGLPLTSNLSFICPDSLLFTGGYVEPGPGGFFKLYL